MRPPRSWRAFCPGIEGCAVRQDRASADVRPRGQSRARGPVGCVGYATSSWLPGGWHAVQGNKATPHRRSIESWKAVVLDIISNDNHDAANDGNPEAPPKVNAA